MFDIHYHMLHGLDDGPRTIDASLELAEASIAEGVSHVVCTPHANSRFKFDTELCHARLAVLNERLQGRLTLGLGCDFHLSYENLQDGFENPTKYTINNKQYLLVEFPDYAISPNMPGMINQLLVYGMLPIITHPERNPTLSGDDRRMMELLRSGCLVQITAGSLTGRFGKIAEATAHRLLKKNWVHFVASDAHSLESRPPAMASAYDLIESRYGQETADRLCIHNPRAAFFGEPVPPQPEPVWKYDLNSHSRSLLARMFRR